MAWIQIPPEERRRFASSFHHHDKMKSTLGLVLKAGRGELFVSENPFFAIASLHSCTYLTGSTERRDWISEVLEQLENPYRFLFDRTDWKSVLQGHYQEQAEVAQREAFNHQNLNLNTLNNLAGKLPPGFAMMPIDPAMVQSWDQDHFPRINEKTTLGLGFAILKDSEVVCAATPAEVFEKLVEIQINTVPEFQRLGLATVAAAKFLSHCLRAGFIPEWDAKDDTSASLARKLGFQSKGKYEVINLVSR